VNTAAAERSRNQRLGIQDRGGIFSVLKIYYHNTHVKVQYTHVSQCDALRPIIAASFVKPHSSAPHSAAMHICLTLPHSAALGRAIFTLSLDRLYRMICSNGTAGPSDAGRCSGSLGMMGWMLLAQIDAYTCM
jgi:hypothetical protein